MEEPWSLALLIVLRLAVLEVLPLEEGQQAFHHMAAAPSDTLKMLLPVGCARQGSPVKAALALPQEPCTRSNIPLPLFRANFPLSVARMIVPAGSVRPACAMRILLNP